MGVDSAWGGVAMDAGVDAAGEKSAAGPTSMTVCGLWAVELDAGAGDTAGDTVASSAVGDMIAAGDGAAADDCAGDGCSAGENGADGEFAIGEACGVAESVAGDGDEAASAARNEESSAAERGTEGDDCAAGVGCIQVDDPGVDSVGGASAGGVLASGSSAAIFGVAIVEGVPVCDPAMAVDAASADAAFVDGVLLAEVDSAVDAAADVPTGWGIPALVANRLAADTGFSANFAAGFGACNGAAADSGIDDSVIAEDASGRISSGPCDDSSAGVGSAGPCSADTSAAGDFPAGNCALDGRGDWFIGRKAACVGISPA